MYQKVNLLSWLNIPLCLLLLSQSSSSEATQIQLPNKASLKVPTLNGLLPISSRISKGKLDNGINYIIRQNTKPENRAEIRLIINAGSILEDEKQQGFAHFVEHMAFNGTKDFKKQEIIEYVESIGMQFGAHLNAYTSFDETVYKLQIPTNEKQTLEKGIHILENWAHKISFEPTEIDKERGVVIEEMRAKQGAGWRVFNQQLPTIYRDSQYASRLPIGKKEILAKGAHKDLIRFYNNWYRPELMSLVAVGDFDPDIVKQLFEKYFSPIKAKHKNSPTRLEYKLPDNQAALISIETDPELTRTSVEIQIKHPILEPVTYAQYRQQLTSQLFIGMLNSRISEATLKPDVPVIGAGSSFARFRADKSAFTLAATAKPKQSKEAINFLLTEFNRVRQHGFTESELERQKQSLLRDLENVAREINTTESVRFAKEYVRHFVRGESIAGMDHYFATGKTLIPSITLVQMNALAQQWYTQNNRIIKISAPEKDKQALPSKQQLLALVHKIEQQQVSDYQDSKVSKYLMSTEPKAGSIIDKNYNQQLDTHTWMLSNGVKVVLKQTDFKQDEIQFSARANGGYSLLGSKLLSKTIMAANIVEMSGVADYDLTDVSRFSKDKQFWVRTSINDNSETVSGASSIKDLTHFMQMLHLKFVKPRKDINAFSSYISRVESSIVDRFNSPRGVFSEKIRLAQYSKNPRSIRIDSDMVKGQDFVHSFDFYQQRFANAANFNFVFVGNIDLNEMENLVSLYIASLPTSPEKSDVVMRNNLRTKGKLKVTVKKGLDPKATVMLNLYGDAKWSHEQKIQLDALESVLSNILRERIREEKSGVYGVTVKSALSRLHNQYSIRLSFTCDPTRVDELLNETQKVIEELKTTNIDEKYVANYIAQKLKSRETALATNRFWKSYLQWDAELDYQQLGLEEFVTLVKNTNTATIKKSANKLFNLEDSLTALLLPEAQP